MKRAKVILAAVLGLFALGGEALAETPTPAVVRPVLVSGHAPQLLGSAFFVAIDAADGTAAAIGTAHTLDRQNLAIAGEVEFRLGNSERSVARSRGFLVPPGIPFAAAGGTIRGDYFVYALSAPPAGVRILKLDRTDVERHARVRLIGIPARGDGPTHEIGGVVTSASQNEIKIHLDRNTDLRGWGGAPVVSERNGRVVGIVQAADHDLQRVTAAPIGGVREALAARPSDAPVLAFAQFRASDPPASLADADRSTDPPVEPIILPLETDSTRIELTIEYPADGLVMADAVCGAFVAGRAVALEGASQQFDVAIVLDTSGSSDEPTGADINGNGVIGAHRMGRIGSFFGEPSLDPGDSILAAEVAAARQLLRGFDPRTTRVSLITFSGGAWFGGHGEAGASRQAMPAALTQVPLTREFARIEVALDDVLRRGGAGETDMAAGIRFGTVELNGLSGSGSDNHPAATKLMFFFTDGEPTAPHGSAARTDNYLAVTREAQLASEFAVQIHSFAIGPLAVDRPAATVAMADITDGFFTPVVHPGELSEIIDAVGFANLEDVAIRSVTTGAGATPFHIAADGSWGGFVALSPGTNQIQVAARASDGAEVVRQVQIVSEPAAQPAEIPPHLAVRHNRLLEECLRDTKSRTVAVEKQHAEEVRRELQIEIERERERARKRADEQRRNLDLKVDEE